MPDSGVDLIRHALQLAREHGFNEVELEAGDLSFEAKLEPAPKAPASSSPSAATAQQDQPVQEGPKQKELVSTLVGYYRPGKNPLRVGAMVAKGDVIASIVALGIANDVEAQHAGEVVDVLVATEQPVQYGQVLARLKVAE